MSRVLITAFLVGSALLACLTAAAPHSAEDQSVIAFLCADDGTYSGMSELHYLSQIVFQQVPMNITYCQSVNLGYARTLSGVMKRVMIATTGIGSVNAAACTTSLLQTTGFEFSQMIFVGTAGMSPFIGGFEPLKETNGCASQGDAESIALSIGSVCVTSVATDMECGTCVSNAASTIHVPSSECSRPDCTQHTEAALFGPCDFNLNSSLADRIVSSNGNIVFPTMPSLVVNGTWQFWASNEAAPETFRSSPPFVPRLVSQCAEADAQQIWVGAPLDYLCREYSVGAMQSGNTSSIPCFVAMEGYAFLQVMSKQSSIPAAIIRGAANWDMYPLTNVGTASQPQWAQNTTYMPDADRIAFIKRGYQYTIRTTNLVVLNYFGSL